MRENEITLVDTQKTVFQDYAGKLFIMNRFICQPDELLLRSRIVVKSGKIQIILKFTLLDQRLHLEQLNLS